MIQYLRLCAAVAAAANLASCGDAPAPEKTETVRPAKLVTVGSASQQRNMSFPAVVRAAQSAELTFPLSGQVVELNVLESDEIERGAIIAKLDQRDAQNNLSQARAEYQNAESEYRRAQRLRDQDAISQSVLEQRQTQLEVRQAAVDTARKALEDTVIRAPFSGGVSRVLVEQFQNVQAKEAIVVLQSGETEAIIDIPGTIIARIPQLEPVNTRVILDAAPDVEIPAVFREASGQADPSTQTYQISFTFDPPEGLLILPGMTATVRSTFNFKGTNGDLVAQGIAVPIDAILAEPTARFVWVVGDDMRLEKRTVRLGQDVTDSVTVTSGLEGSETIVAAGVSFLAEGMQVREWQPD
ncbi:MAG: efflux RND transporter periplasmic adaptor subunit [Pseudomonadota bacterium]